MAKIKKVTIEITEKQLEILEYLIVKESMIMTGDMVKNGYTTYTLSELEELYLNLL